ncbi:hypothetical protein I7F13_02270 [Sinorhizobium meliloti]|nr:hypothetical protein [Sinorhizobium meliloti]
MYDDEYSGGEVAHALRAPIDLFFRSLAEEHGSELAFILTGAGADGAIGGEGCQGGGRNRARPGS